MKNENQLHVLNDLVKINNDRIEGYTKAIEELKDEDGDLKQLFSTMVLESRENNSELNQKITGLGGATTFSTTAAGKIYRIWMDVKATFSGHNRKAILENCERGEDAAKRAYKMANDEDLDADVLNIIMSQQSKQLNAHDKIKSLKDTL